MRLINVVASSPDRALAARAAEEAASWARRWIDRERRTRQPSIDLVGPAPAPIEKLHGRWRWHFLLRSASPSALGLIAETLAIEVRTPHGDARLALDRDPVALL